MSGTASPAAAPTSIDPALPELASALDGQQAGALFQRRWPGPQPAPPIAACTREHVRWSPGTDCVITFRLLIAASAGEPAVTFGAVSVRPDGVRHWLYTDDPELPGLAGAADPARMAAWLGDNLGRRVRACTVSPVRYRPGSRCVLRYEIAALQTTCYGKVLAGSRSAAVASIVAALGESLVAPLVGHAPERQLVVQRDAGAESLARMELRSPGTLALVRATGRLLARMHAHSGAGAEARTLAADARELSTFTSLVERVDAASSERFVEGVELLRSFANREQRSVAGHGALRLNQVHVVRGEPVLIDLDTYCRAAPERDAGNVLAYLRWRQIRGAASAEAVDLARDAILSGYGLEADGALNAARLRAFEAASLLRIAGRRCRSLDSERWAYLPALIDLALLELRAPRM